MVRNDAGSIVSETARLTVNSSVQITRQPRPETASAGDSVSFSITAEGTPPLRYQWRFNGAIFGDRGVLLSQNLQAFNAGAIKPS